MSEKLPLYDFNIDKLLEHKGHLPSYELKIHYLQYVIKEWQMKQSTPWVVSVGSQSSISLIKLSVNKPNTAR